MIEIQSSETCQVQEEMVLTLEQMQVPNRTETGVQTSKRPPLDNNTRCNAYGKLPKFNKGKVGNKILFGNKVKYWCNVLSIGSDAKPKRRHGAAYLTHTKTVFFLAKIYDSATKKKCLFYINR